MTSACGLAADDSPDDVATGRAEFAKLRTIPWYDHDKDTLQPVLLTAPSEWDFSWLGKPMFWLAVAAIIAGFAILAWQILRTLAKRNRQQGLPASAAEPLVTADWVEALPYLRERSRDDLLGQARRHYEQGNYAEAIIYLFSYELVELDRSALVRLAKGKTNRQYLREAERWRPIAGLLEQTMHAFEDVFFGGRALDRAGFETCWNQLGLFEQLLAGAQPAS